MNAEEARKLANKNGFEQKVQKKISEVEESIRRACEYGHTRTCVFAFYNDNDKSSVDLEVKKHFLEQGYTFRKTPMNGGVPQDTEDICW
mgnify:CR=1 FL=1